MLAIIAAAHRTEIGEHLVLGIAGLSTVPELGQTNTTASL